jgi:hypothetical protein
VASKKTLNAKNLEELGAPRLAELLMDISTGNAAAKRRLRLELAGAQSPEEVAREVSKRLATIKRSRSFVDWQNRRALVDDLETQRRAIVEQVAKTDPNEGLSLMWRFLGLANSVFERCDDSSGTVIDIFHGAVDDMADIARRANIAPDRLADAVFDALKDNDYGQYDELIATLAPVMGQTGLQHLKQRVIALSKEPQPKPADAERRAIGWSSTTGPIYQDEMDARSRDSMVRLALIDVADALGDVDGFMAQYDDQTRKVPRIAAEIATRLATAGRADEALVVLDNAHTHAPRWSEHAFDVDFEWDNARIAVLESLARSEDAQAMRWACFERALSTPHLREYLKRLPDFDDLDAEARAFAHAHTHSIVFVALHFFIEWPALDQAAKLVLDRAAKLDGNYYEYLTPAADALSAKHPLAATLLLRAMIDFTLTHARSSRYKHAARHLLECASLARHIADYGAFENHDAYITRLRQQHELKSGFWSLVS